VRWCRLAVEVKAGCTAIEEATDPPDHPEGEPLELEGVEEASVIHGIEGPFNIELQETRYGTVAPGCMCSIDD
jgi:hypothetical protein